MDQDHGRSGHSRHLRNVLRAAREAQGLTGQEVADRVAKDLGKDSFSGQAIRYYERFERHPPIDVFAAWARALGYRLIVDLDRATNSRSPVLVRHAEVAEIARALDEAPPEARAAILGVVRAFIK